MFQEKVVNFTACSLRRGKLTGGQRERGQWRQRVVDTGEGGLAEAARTEGPKKRWALCLLSA
jgi:hypothetical protein